MTYIMKASAFIIASLMVFSSCTKVVMVKTNPNGKVPPGQQKQATGSQSAKPYAPGQQKQATGSQSAKPYAPGQQKQGNASSNAPKQNGNSGNAPGQQKQKKK